MSDRPPVRWATWLVGIAFFGALIVAISTGVAVTPGGSRWPGIAFGALMIVIPGVIFIIDPPRKR